MKEVGNVAGIRFSADTNVDSGAIPTGYSRKEIVFSKI